MSPVSGGSNICFTGDHRPSISATTRIYHIFKNVTKEGRLVRACRSDRSVKPIVIPDTYEFVQVVLSPSTTPWYVKLSIHVMIFVTHSRSFQVSSDLPRAATGGCIEPRMSLELGSGAGSGLPLAVLVLSGLSTLVAVLVSAMSIYLHLKNYRKPILQRFASLQSSSLCVWGGGMLILVQNGHTNHGHGPYLRGFVSHFVVFVGGCLRDRCNKGYIRGTFGVVLFSGDEGQRGHVRGFLLSLLVRDPMYWCIWKSFDSPVKSSTWC